MTLAGAGADVSALLTVLAEGDGAVTVGRVTPVGRLVSSWVRTVVLGV